MFALLFLKHGSTLLYRAGAGCKAFQLQKKKRTVMQKYKYANNTCCLYSKLFSNKMREVIFQTLTNYPNHVENLPICSLIDFYCSETYEKWYHIVSGTHRKQSIYQNRTSHILRSRSYKSIRHEHLPSIGHMLAQKWYHSTQVPIYLWKA